MVCKSPSFALLDRQASCRTGHIISSRCCKVLWEPLLQLHVQQDRRLYTIDCAAVHGKDIYDPITTLVTEGNKSHACNDLFFSSIQKIIATERCNFCCPKAWNSKNRCVSGIVANCTRENLREHGLDIGFSINFLKMSRNDNSFLIGCSKIESDKKYPDVKKDLSAIFSLNDLPKTEL